MGKGTMFSGGRFWREDLGETAFHFVHGGRGGFPKTLIEFLKERVQCFCTFIVNLEMHPFLRPIKGRDGEVTRYAFWCPGCASIHSRHGLHVFTVKDADGDPEQEWSFDGEAFFEPSLVYEDDPYCHLHLTQGMIR